MITFLNFLGTIAFSVSGAIEAIKKQMDILGVLVLGLVTSIGGGILRDMIMGELPPAIFGSPEIIITAIFVAFATFIICYSLPKKKREKYYSIYNNVMFISDSVGLGAFTILGIRCVNEEYGYTNPALLIFVGVLTGVGGGIIRDVIAGNVPFVLRKHIYATASILGGVTYLLLQMTDLAKFSTAFSLITVLLLRFLAAHYSWNLPRVDNYE